MNEPVTIGPATLYNADALAVLPLLSGLDLPETPCIAAVSGPVTDLAAGHAAEHLVCADLLLSGYKAFLTDQICAYDVAAEIHGRLVRIQVKATRAPKLIAQNAHRPFAYQWNVRRAGKHGRRTYGENEFDMLALVALDVKKIAYLPPSRSRQTIHIRWNELGERRARNGKTTKTFAELSFDAALHEISQTREHLEDKQLTLAF
ncbi:group I intron-associated PD-(D/E)XK endonuclease [Paraburkholderia adhaesiva]|uniref:group I intron-associated PD-(D/E)XK endonuclease n=1 Tax=Paraburkholderia adhaesiva TaxID=2883244 RepID=UPI001F32FFB0|nr:group I intron-associated PD-(D/E)XK endonuclease [Paraburkholderia adhaesiva]